MIADIAYWAIGVIIVLSFVVDISNWRSESKHEVRIAELAERIENLETLAATPDAIDGFEV